MLKEKFPNHCAFEEHNWITSISGDKFENKSKHKQVRGNEDLSEDINRGQYSKASPCIKKIDNKWMSNIGL